ncbi:tripartite tricarboxylate transporter TctB family protein [Jiella sp. MQZ9-1]|uniref:Tripartite tricarboxylate transporter TctB family protein n=1 Tax=Jiella flava TaxID=2816857 RepID=A0A939FZM7_9HYPH|nr:tripartite tricarboxylate transporter TctB family protein [Jiella flava]MBO0663131.1 tripartite tricarboxylate transporter TctB family protein [Jiella flava]MCD2471550.1 tripartite tricarboxylate transporter TctB family protein [Jiella flava]
MTDSSDTSDEQVSRSIGRLIVSAAFVVASPFFLAASLLGAAGSDMNIAAGDTSQALPHILLVVWVALGLVDLFREATTFFRAPAAPDSQGRSDDDPVLVLAIMAATVGLAVAIVFFGYMVPIVLILPLLLRLAGVRSLGGGIVAFLILGPGLWWLFNDGLGIRLPALLSGGMF